MNDLTFYMDTRPSIKTGDAIEWAGTSCLARAIRFFTGKKVNHTSMVVRMDLFDLQDRVFVLEALSGGIDVNLLSEELLRHDGSAYWLPLTHISYQQRERMARFGFMSSSKRYDFGSLVSNIMGKVNRNADRFFCSEFYHYALIAARVIPGRDTKARRPGEFIDLGVHAAEVRLI